MDEFPQYALPKLYGGPAYARPAVAVAHTPRPVDPDDLPLVAQMTEDDIEILATLDDTGGRVPATRPGQVATAPPPEHPRRRRPISIRAVANRLRRPRP
jgi:hypothetical protein